MRALSVSVIVLLVACSSTPRGSDAMAVDGGVDGRVDGDVTLDAGDCSPVQRFFDDITQLNIEVDVTGFGAREYAIRESITLRATEAGDSISLFGTALLPVAANHRYVYDGQIATFCTEPFDAGDEVTLEIEYVVSESHQAFPPENLAGIRIWGDEGGAFAIGTFTSPFFSSTWLFSPQALTWIDAEHDDNVSVAQTQLTVTVPNDEWFVIGPGAADVEGTRYRFSVGHPMPLYTLSFAASPAYERLALPTTSSGVEMEAASFPASSSAMASHLGAAARAIDWMDRNVGAYPWDVAMTFAEIPDFPGGMEHTGGVWLGTPVIGRPVTGDYTAAHEAVHHWFGNDVRVASFAHLWMSEGFTEWITVFEASDDVLGPAAGSSMRAIYRADAVDRSFPGGPGMPLPGPLRMNSDDDVPYQVGANLLYFYSYGAVFLEMVHQRLLRGGDDLLVALSDWYAARSGTSVTTENFLAFLIDRTGDSALWTQLFDEWVYSGPVPILEVRDYEWTGTEARFDIVRLDGGGQTLDPLEIAPDTTSVVSVALTADAAEVQIAAASEPTRLVVDPAGLYAFRISTEPGWAGPPVTGCCLEP